jgi:hypothetical protein
MDRNDAYQTILVKILEKTELHGNKGCLLWLGAKTDKLSGPSYGKLRAKLPKDEMSKCYYAHRLCYMAKHHILELPRQLHVSHLCHFSLCVTPAHLSLEPASVNVERQKCGDICLGHKIGNTHFPDCILW